MARIVAGAAIPRGPTFTMMPERWGPSAERDKTSPWLRKEDGSPAVYDDLVRDAGPSLQEKLTRASKQRRYAESQRAFADVLQAFHKADPDIAVVMGDDENEWFSGSATPPLAVYRGATWAWGPDNTEYPVAVELTDHVVQHLQNAGYTVEVIDKPVDGKPMPHAFGLHYDRLLKSPVPMVPVLVNVHFPPTQPTIVEQYKLGQEVRKAVESWREDQSIAVVADGGLSVGIVREEIDHSLLDALKARDMAALGEIPYRWIQGQSGEIFNWIGAAGALEGLEMKVWDYVPTYRSPAGTGCGNAFATWA